MHYIEGQKVWGRQEREGKLSGGWGGGTMQEMEGAFGQVPRYQFLNYMEGGGGRGRPGWE